MDLWYTQKTASTLPFKVASVQTKTAFHCFIFEEYQTEYA